MQAATEAAAAAEVDAKKIVYQRSKAVRAYVLARANGSCESCHEPAPFARKDGTPYLEPHHTRRVSDGGPDHPRWVGGICPNCHTEIHFGKDGAAKNSALADFDRMRQRRMQ
jgi:5-methylcytosine-specific restriction enzyme A